jgi:AraC family transcriptional activator of pobA
MRQLNQFLNIPATIKHFLPGDGKEHIASTSDYNKTGDKIVVLRHRGDLTEDLAVKLDHYALVFCVGGIGIRTVNQFRFEIRPGTLHLATPQSLNAYHQASADLDLYFLLFRKELLTDRLIRDSMIENLLAPGGDSAPVWNVRENRRNIVYTLFDRMHTEYISVQPHKDQMMQLIFLELLLETNRASDNYPQKTQRPGNRPQQITANFKKLIDEHYLMLRTVQDYADKLFITPKHLSDVVRQETGQSPLYLLHNRLFQEAKYWLCASDLAMKEIADKLNFDSSSHFSRFFKQFSGHNPTDFQRLQCVII